MTMNNMKRNGHLLLSHIATSHRHHYEYYSYQLTAVIIIFSNHSTTVPGDAPEEDLLFRRGVRWIVPYSLSHHSATHWLWRVSSHIIFSGATGAEVTGGDFHPVYRLEHCFKLIVASVVLIRLYRHHLERCVWQMKLIKHQTGKRHADIAAMGRMWLRYWWWSWHIVYLIIHLCRVIPLSTTLLYIICVSA